MGLLRHAAVKGDGVRVGDLLSVPAALLAVFLAYRSARH